MGEAQQLKATRQQLRKAFGAAACETIEDLAKRQFALDATLNEIVDRQRALDARTRELRDELRALAERLMPGFVNPDV